MTGDSLQALKGDRRTCVTVIVHGYFPESFGGIPVFLKMLTSQVEKSGARVCIITKTDDRAPIYERQTENVAVYRLHMPLRTIRARFPRISYGLFLINCLIHAPMILRREGTTVLFGQGVEYGGIQSVIVSKLVRIPVVVTIHGVDRHLSRAASCFLKNADHIVVQREETARALSSMGFMMNRVTEIPNGVPTVFPEPKHVSANELRVLFVGRFDDFKSPTNFVEAAKILQESGKMFRFTMIGDGPLFETVKSMISDLRLENTIEMMGRMDDPSPGFREADVFVACSPYENYISLALLEAMAQGLAIVATDVGETRRIVKDGQNGLLCASTPQDIAKILLVLHDDRRLVNQLGQEARKTQSAQYSLEKMSSDYLAIFEGISRNRD